MAFTSTPTSGNAPYIFSADINNNGSINGVDYVATIMHSSENGSCPGLGSDMPSSQERVNAIVSGVPFDIGAKTIEAGVCRTYTLYITRVADNVVIDSASVSIDNV